jgi:hypothetical protein
LKGLLNSLKSSLKLNKNIEILMRLMQFAQFVICARNTLNSSSIVGDIL